MYNKQQSYLGGFFFNFYFPKPVGSDNKYGFAMLRGK